MSDEELLPKIEQSESENSSDESKKDKDTNLADLSEMVKDMESN